MKKVTTTIIGGGFSGMICAALIKERHGKVLLLERSDRLGKKLSATGNGQGNLTNVNFGCSHYFTQNSAERDKIERILSIATEKDLIHFFEGLGGLFSADERGRVYPTCRQASSLTDLLRYRLSGTRNDSNPYLYRTGLTLRNLQVRKRNTRCFPAPPRPCPNP